MVGGVSVEADPLPDELLPEELVPEELVPEPVSPEPEPVPLTEVPGVVGATEDGAVAGVTGVPDVPAPVVDALVVDECPGRARLT